MITNSGINRDSTEAANSAKKHQRRRKGPYVRHAVPLVAKAKGLAKSNDPVRMVDDISPTFCLRTQIISVFLEESTSSIRTESGTNDLRTVLWFLRLPSLVAKNDAVETSALALSCIVVGRSRNDHRMIRQGMGAYGRALKLINNALSSRTSESQEHGMIACFNLLAGQLYANQPKDFAAHINGIGAIMLHRGPNAFAAGNARGFLLAVRLHLILGALTTRQKTFLADEQWLCAATLDAECRFEILISAMTKLPAIRATFVKMQNTFDPEARLSTAVSLLDSAWNLRNAMHQWSLVHCTGILQPPKEGEVSPSDATTADELRNPCFASFKDAVMMNLFWASLVELYNIMAQLYEVVGMFHAHADAPATLESNSKQYRKKSVRPFVAAGKCRGSAMQYATQICSALKYFSFSSGNAFRSVYMLFPLKVAFRCFVLNLPRSAAWLELLQEALDSLTRSGAYIVQSLAEDNGVY